MKNYYITFCSHRSGKVVHELDELKNHPAFIKNSYLTIDFLVRDTPNDERN